MENVPENYQHIKGWGVDADPNNNPTYPMKNYTGADHERLNYERPPQQPITVEVLHSNERPNVTAVFGTSTPPSGLSGAIRRYAFTKSEGSWGHWLPLILADRVNMVEGIIDDFRKGIVPNIIEERGWTAEWKYNRKNVIKNVLISAAAVAAFIAFSSTKKKLKKAKASKVKTPKVKLAS